MIKKLGDRLQGFVFLIDILLAAASYLVACLIRFEGAIPESELNVMLRTLPLVVVVRAAAFIYFKLDKSIWYYASIKDLALIIKGVTVSSAIIAAIVIVLHIGHSRSVWIIDWLLLIISLSGVRLLIRLTRPFRERGRSKDKVRKKVLIIGAGDAGETILRELIYRYDHDYEVVGIIDDDLQKLGRSIHGVTVLGNRESIAEFTEKRKVEEIIIATPTMPGEEMRDIVEKCVRTGVRYRTLPHISDLVDGKVEIKKLREVRVEDLLSREVIKLHEGQIESYLAGKTILITGAGGSIGSELCFQSAKYRPRRLLLLDQSEVLLFYTDMSLQAVFPDVRREILVGDITDRVRLKEIFETYRPQIVFHAAAYKHVPLMERQLREAVKNNTIGSKRVADMAREFGVEKFVNISTDKAVNPTSLMGASKRAAERYLAALPSSPTQFVSVRFGNVLDSQGSVIPLFKKQIERGGPVTVTHPEIERYFITISEAAGLVIEAGAMAGGGGIFILKMGVPVRITDLARDLIKLSGLDPDWDIEVVFTGLRPGEKMSEALVAKGEEVCPTANEKISLIRSKEVGHNQVVRRVAELENLIREGDSKGLLAKLRDIVPEYQPGEVVREQFPGAG